MIMIYHHHHHHHHLLARKQTVPLTQTNFRNWQYEQDS